MQFTGAEILIKALADQGVGVIFGYPGGAILPIYDALYKQNSVRHYLVRHEQAAVHAAEGYARSIGKVGVVLVTSGPGATNAVTGLTDALMDSIPIVCLTGQVPTHMIGNDAFQEADTVGITRPCTKHNYLIRDVNVLAAKVHEALHVARSGRPGPVVIDLPKDVLNTLAVYTAPNALPAPAYRPQVTLERVAVERAVDLMLKAERPVFYVGGGVINAGTEACESLVRLVRATGFPITMTLMGLGAYPASDRQSLGMLGMHGTLEANLAMHYSDLMINLGARFDDRVTGRLDGFSPDSIKIHADIDPSSINKHVAVDLPIVGDAGNTIQALLEVWERRKAEHDPARIGNWWEKIAGWRAQNSLGFQNSAQIIKPQYAIRRLWEMTRDYNPYITTEVGQHQMWAAQHFGFDQPNHWMTSGGLGTMGYGLPAAMGVQVAHPDALVIDIAGEASTMMNIQELSSLIQHRLPVKVFILNNEWMGMVRQWQELFHGGRYSESYSVALPDFVKLAEAFGAKGLRAHSPDDLDDVIREMIAHDGPVVVDIRVDKGENVYPMIPAGAAHHEIILGPGRELDACKSKEGMSLVSLDFPSRSSPAPGVRQLPMVIRNEPITQHTISVLVDNESGVLAHVIGRFSGRGYNIDSLTVAEVNEVRTRSRITIVTSGTQIIIEQIKTQLTRLVPVHAVTDLTQSGSCIGPELALVQLTGTWDRRVESLRIADIFRARVVDSTHESFILEMAGSTEKIEAFSNLMRPLGLADVARTGIAALSRGAIPFASEHGRF